MSIDFLKHLHSMLKTEALNFQNQSMCPQALKDVHKTSLVSPRAVVLGFPSTFLFLLSTTDLYRYCIEVQLHWYFVLCRLNICPMIISIVMAGNGADGGHDRLFQCLFETASCHNFHASLMSKLSSFSFLTFPHNEKKVRPDFSILTTR